MLSAIIVAGGSSRRMGFDKLFALVAGEPVIAHAIRAFEDTSTREECGVRAVKQQKRKFGDLSDEKNKKKGGTIPPGGKRGEGVVRAGVGGGHRYPPYSAVNQNTPHKHPTPPP